MSTYVFVDLPFLRCCRCSIPVCTSYWLQFVPSLVESAPAEVVGDDDVGDGVEDELHVLRVRRARHVAVDLLRRRLVLSLELRLDVRSSLAVLLCTCTGWMGD